MVCDAINRLSAARINCGRGDNLSRARLPEIFHQRWILFVVSREITPDNLLSLSLSCSLAMKIWKWRRIRCLKVAVSRETHRDEKARERKRESIRTMGAVTLSSRGLTLARGYFDEGDKRARAERVFMCTRCLYSWGTRNLICGLCRLICGLDLVNVGKLIRWIDNLAKRCSRRWMSKFVIPFRAVGKFVNLSEHRQISRTIRWFVFNIFEAG